MRTPGTLLASVAMVLGLLAAGCDAGHSVGEIPEPDTPTPDETPLIEPVSPPANEVDRPDDLDADDS